MSMPFWIVAGGPHGLEIDFRDLRIVCGMRDVHENMKREISNTSPNSWFHVRPLSRKVDLDDVRLLELPNKNDNV